MRGKCVQQDVITEASTFLPPCQTGVTLTFIVTWFLCGELGRPAAPNGTVANRSSIKERIKLTQRKWGFLMLMSACLDPRLFESDHLRSISTEISRVFLKYSVTRAQAVGFSVTDTLFNIRPFEYLQTVCSGLCCSSRLASQPGGQLAPPGGQLVATQGNKNNKQY